MEEQLSNAIADSIAPTIMPDIEIASLAGKTLLCIRVAHWPGPFYLLSEGPEQGVYIRLGSTNRVAASEFIAEIKRQQQNRTFDQLPCSRYGIDDLDMPFIHNTFAGIGRIVEEKQMGIKDRKYFFKAYLTPALQSGLLTPTIPGKPKSKLQRYNLTELGEHYLKSIQGKDTVGK